MKTLLSRTFLTSGDFKRLKESFFSSAHLPDGRTFDKKKMIILSVSILFILTVALIFFSSFDIVILSNYKYVFGNGAIDLLSKKDIGTPALINPHGNSKIVKKVIYMDIPFDRKSGFSLNFKDKFDMANSKLALVVKKPDHDFNIDVILRDNRFFSNALSPITLEVPFTTDQSGYIEIPIDISDNVPLSLNLLNISQLRFMFYQKKENSLPIFVKNVLFEKRR